MISISYGQQTTSMPESILVTCRSHVYSLEKNVLKNVMVSYSSSLVLLLSLETFLELQKHFLVNTL